jgi:hypothetical protein
MKGLKTSLGDDNVQMLKMRTEKLGYHFQYTRNMLQLNNAGNNFTETALNGVQLPIGAGVHCLRIDQDGEQDLLWAMEFQTSQ